MERSTCIGCGRKMYKVPPSVGTPSEWRHDSSGHAISWSPERHIAGVMITFEHQHKWTPADKNRTRRCEVTGCDSEMIEMAWEPPPPMTANERKTQESRLRGAVARNRSKQKVPSSTPS